MTLLAPSRRGFALGLAATGLAALTPRAFAMTLEQEAAADTSGLRPLTNGVEPISEAEHLQRVRRAQALMRERGIGALIIEPGASMIYFSGVRWNRSERLTALIIPAQGDATVVTPFFEAPSVRESLKVPGAIRTWNEDEDPTRLVADVLRDNRVAHPVGIEETVRFFAVDGLRRAYPELAIVAGAPVIRAIRMRKSPAELRLMQVAADITIAAYRHTYPRIRAGMTPAEIGAMMNAATRALGGNPEFALILLGEASAYPHGSGQPQQVREGEVVLMDCGCTVHGYQSDISRTFVHGRATDEQRRVWDHVHRGQEIAFAAARIGRPAGSVDDAVRAHYESLGYGPGYRLPGLSHRTGHGIGMEGHEPVNFVHGEETALAAGMCFSNEPGIYLPGRFGIRLEDCIHMTEAGPRWFSEPPPSIDRPFD